MALSLALDSTPSSLAASLVALAGGFTTQTLAVSSGAALSFEGRSAADGVEAVLRHIAHKAGREEMCGASDAEAAQVIEWFTILQAELAGAGVGEPFLQRLEAHLLSSSFLPVSAWQPTIADYEVWAAIQSVWAATATNAATFPCVARWSRCIVASIPRGASYTAWIKTPLAAPELPAALQSTLFEMDLLAQGAADRALRAGVPAAAAGANVKAAAPPAAAAKGDKKAAPAKEAAAASSAAPADKADKKKKEKPAKAAKPAAAADTVPQVYRLDMRVARILSAEAHPTEARLYVLQVEVGEDKPRTVVSGLADFMSAADLRDRLAVCVVNLKAGDLKGVVSAGRLMVATSADGAKKELAAPPANAQVGDRITFASVPADKAADAECASKRFSDILKGLHTNKDKQVCFKDDPFMTQAGAVTVDTIADGTVA